MYASDNGATVFKLEIRERGERGRGDHQLHTTEVSLASLERLTVSFSVLMSMWEVFHAGGTPQLHLLSDYRSAK